MDVNITFYAVSLAIIKLFILALIGYLLRLRNVIDDKFVDTLSLLLVRGIFPALIISKTVTHFNFIAYPLWWIFPLAAILFSALGAGIGLVIRPFLKNRASGKEFVASVAFQNCGYLPMNLILFSFAGALADKLLIYMFLFLIGFNLVMWSFVPFFLAGRKSGMPKRDILFNPPVVATIFSLLVVAIAGPGSLPPVLMDPLRQLGRAAFPLAMLTLGAYLCRYKAYGSANKGALIVGGAAKLFLLPLLTLPILYFVPLSYDHKFFLFLESMMPTAVSLVVIGSYVKCDNKFFSSSIFYTHIVAIFSIPFWLMIFKVFL